MYENCTPLARQSRLVRSPLSPGDGTPASGGALRAVAWHELTARLRAARDLRTVLREDARTQPDIGNASFTDAAASYFRALGLGEPAINPAAIDEPKGCDGNTDERGHIDADGPDGGTCACPPVMGASVREESMGETDND